MPGRTDDPDIFAATRHVCSVVEAAIDWLKAAGILRGGVTVQ
jgi:hypothetical protein